MIPASEAELAEMVAGGRGALSVRGGGTRGIPVVGEVLDVSALGGVTLYEPGALTLVAGAGTTVAEIEAVLAAENQRLAFEPMDHRGLLGTGGAPTIGGVAAGNISGPRRIQAGAARDYLLGVRFVDGQGRVIRNGGRVMKNVTGYDLVKLMAGSWGTLGVLSEVALKVLPRAETSATVRVHGVDAAHAVAAMSAALGSPFEVSGAACDPGAQEVYLRLEGFEASVRYRAGRVKETMAGFGEVEIVGDDADSRTLWQGIRDVKAFQDRPGDVWRLSVKPSDAPGVIGRLQAEAVMLDWGGGLIWARMAEGSDLRARMGGVAGHATLIRAGDETRAGSGMFHPEPAALAAISAGLRAKFDPKGLFNPGLMAPRRAA